MLQLKNIKFKSDMLESIVPIYDTAYGMRVVNARELHEALNLKKKFSDWIKNNTKEYQGCLLVDNVEPPANLSNFDFFMFEIAATQGKGRSVEYYISLDLAKELAMMTRTDNGKVVRRYFIAAEKALRNISNVMVKSAPVELTPEQKIAEALLLSQKILSEKDESLKRANRNKEYNKKVNVRLRQRVKSLESENLSLREQIAEESNEVVMKVEPFSPNQDYNDIVLELENSIERLSDENIKLQTRIVSLIRTKTEGKSLLNAICSIDISRRQKFSIGAEAKNNAKIAGYVFRKDSIMEAGIPIRTTSKNLLDGMDNVDIPRAVSVYRDAVKKLISNSEVYDNLFADIDERVNSYLDTCEFNSREEEQEKQVVL